ncbi:MAG: FKBP-type peptidyl-prolyl cis-trans isomerase [Bacteroidota bacterium]
MRILLPVLAAIVLLIQGACQEPSFEKQLKLDTEIIEEYIADNNLQGQWTEAGNYYVVDKAGDGTTYPQFFSTVQVVYTGTLLADGTEFDSSDGFPVPFELGRVVTGFRDGLMQFSEGGRGTIIIPSPYGYGNNGTPSIPGKSILRFDITLTDVVN